MIILQEAILLSDVSMMIHLGYYFIVVFGATKVIPVAIIDETPCSCVLLILEVEHPTGSEVVDGDLLFGATIVQER
jgi:hypothetical protein